MRVVVAIAAVLALSAGCAPPGAPVPLFSSDPHADNPIPDERSEDDAGVVTSPDALRRFLPKGIDTTETDALLHAWTDELATSGGWGTFAPVLLRFGPADDGSAFDGKDVDESALAFVRLDGKAPVVHVRTAWHTDPGVLEVQPLSPVAAHARVGLVVLRSLVKGRAVPRPPAFATLADGASHDDVAGAAAALGVSPDDVALVVAYKTADSTRDLLRARDLVKDVVPAFRFDDENDGRHGVFAPADAPSSLTDHPDELQQRLTGAGLVAVGFYTSLDVRDPATRTFAEDILAGHTPPKENDIEVVLVEPDPATFPPPWPAVILQHGFQGSNAFVVDNAAPFVKRGMAVLGIDAVSHGRRGNVAGFFDLTDPRTVRDNLRQTTVDHLVLANLATKGHVDVDGVPGDDLDGTLAYYGHSMGAILGSSFSMVSQDVDVVAVNAPGGGLCDIFRSKGLHDTLQLLIRPLLGIGIDDPVYDDAYPLLTALAQPLLEGADPIAYARATNRPHLLLQKDLGDLLVPNGSTDDLAAAAGVPARASGDDPDGLDAVTALDPSQYPDFTDPNPHGLFDQKPVQEQAAQFVATRGKQLLAAP